MSPHPFVDRPVGDLEAAAHAARSGALQWGLAPPNLLRLGMNAIFRCGDVVLRVGRPTAEPVLAHRLSEVLGAAGVPVVRPVDGLVGVFDGLAVTGWEYVEASDRVGETRSVAWERVGDAVRRVHGLAPTELPQGYPLPSPVAFAWWDFDSMMADVADLLDHRARTGIRDVLRRHAGWDSEVAREAHVCHGDVHPGNVLQGPSGPLLIDWDLMCRAPAAWDHAMLITYAERWGGSADVYRCFASGYGRSMVDDRVTLMLGDLRNVAATLMRVRAGRSDPRAATEAERRLRYWRGERDAPAWSAQ